MDPILVIILIVIIIILIVYFSGAYKKAMIEIPEYIPYLYVVHNNKIDEDERKLLQAINEYNSYKKRLEYINRVCTLYISKLEGLRVYNKKMYNTFNEIYVDLLNERKKIEKIISEFTINSFCVDNSVPKEYILQFLQKIIFSCDNKELSKIVGMSKYILTYSKAYVCFIEQKIVVFSKDLTDVSVYNYRELNYSVKTKIVTTLMVKPEDEIISKKWLYSRKNGERDLRYSNNCLVYEVQKYFFYFARIPEFVLELPNENEKKRFCRCLDNLLGENNKVVEENSIKKDKVESKQNSGSPNKSDKIKQEKKVNTKSEHKFKKNDIVIHPVFGEGEVKQVYYDYYEIKFGSSISRISVYYNKLRKKENCSTEKEVEVHNVKDVIQKVINKKPVYFYHPIYGCGELISLGVMNKEVKFANSVKTISDSYKLMKEITYDEYVTYNKKRNKKYYYHPTFGYGELIENSNNTKVIKFKNGTQKVISNTYQLLREVDLFEYENEKIQVLEKEQIEKNKQDFIVHNVYGKGILLDSNNEKLNVLFENGEVYTIDKNDKRYKFTDDKISEKKVGLYDYIFSKKYGFGRILYLDNQIGIFFQDKMKYIDNKYLQLVEIIPFHKGKYIELKLFDYVKRENEIFIINDINKESVLLKKMGSELTVNSVIRELEVVDLNEVRKKYQNEMGVSKRREFIMSLVNDIYTFSDIENLYFSFFNNNPTNEDIKKIMKEALYILEDDIFIHKKYKSLEDYLINVSITRKIYRKEIYNNSTYDYLLKKLCDKYMFLDYGDGIYFTLQKFGELKLKITDFEILHEKIILLMKNKVFITIKNIRNEIDCDIIKKIDTDVALCKLIETFKDIKKRRFGNKDLFHIRDLLTKDEFIVKLIKNEMAKKQVKKIDIYNLIEDLNLTYDLQFEYYEFVSILNNINDLKQIYFSEEMDMIYENKKRYYEEVYGNGS